MSTLGRYSLRLREKQHNASPQPANAVTHSEHQQPSDTSTIKPNSSKRRKISSGAEQGFLKKPVARPDGRVKGRRGHLQLVTKMPMDVLYEVLSSLEPIDLLHLSWASKALQSIIMGKSMRYIWEGAFEALYASPHPPPPCPSDINLAQYTKLLFDKRCMECNSPHGSHVIWSHRMRVCSNCLESDRFVVLASPYQYWTVIPMIRTFVHGRYQTFVLASEYNKVKAKMDCLSPDSSELRAFTKDRGEWLAVRRQDEWKFSQWQREQKRDRKTELEEIRIKRRDVILNKLGGLGWGDELAHLNSHQLWTFPGMRVAKPLTDKAWESLCPELIDHLEAVKALRLEREKQDGIIRRCNILAQKIKTWAKKHTHTDLLPKVFDFALSDPFKSFILDGSEEEPEFATDDTFFAFLKEWNEARDEFLISLIYGPTRGSKPTTKGKEKAERDPAILKLATTFFQCPECVEPIAYPRVLAHQCQRTCCTLSNKRDTDPDHLVALCFGATYQRPWLCNAQDLTFFKQASDVAKVIVQECGANPDEATPESMDELDSRLECLRCKESKKSRLVMKWQMAILHDLEKHSIDTDTCSASSRRGKKTSKAVDEAKWRLVTNSGDLALISAKELGDTPREKYLFCKLCGNGRTVTSELSSMQNHWDLYHSHFGGLISRILDHLTGGSSSLPEAEVLPMPEEAELMTMFEQHLDQSIRNSYNIVKIPTRRTDNKDSKY